jgi:hypothetical protein
MSTRPNTLGITGRSFNHISVTIRAVSTAGIQCRIPTCIKIKINSRVQYGPRANPTNARVREIHAIRITTIDACVASGAAIVVIEGRFPEQSEWAAESWIDLLNGAGASGNIWIIEVHIHRVVDKSIVIVRSTD